MAAHRLIACALMLALTTACRDRVPASESGTQAVTIAHRTFELELALDDAARWRGLSDRAAIDPAGGMLFVFPYARELEFVMRRCLTPIDIIFLDSGGRITAMHAMRVEPYDTPDENLTRYSSRYKAQFALELAGGTLESLPLQVGQKIDLPADRLKAMAR